MSNQRKTYILIIIGLVLLGFATWMIFEDIQVIIINKSFSAGLAFLLSGLIVIVFSIATIESRRSTRNMLIAVALGMGFLFGYSLWCNTTFTIPHRFKYDLYKDLLVIILASATIIIALLGYAVYRILENTILVKVDTLTKNVYNKSLAKTLIDMGYFWWKSYEGDKKKNIWALENAIEVTRKVSSTYLEKISESDSDKTKLTCTVKNNLAYYLAEFCRIGKGTDNDKILALDFAEFIYTKKSDFPLSDAEQFIDTYIFVNQVFSK